MEQNSVKDIEERYLRRERRENMFFFVGLAILVALASVGLCSILSSGSGNYETGKHYAGSTNYSERR